MALTNSPLVSYTKISPHKTVNRNHAIDTISIHTMAGNCSVETCGAIFQGTRKASSNYGIGSDGRIGMYVEEKDRSMCTSNAANDHRAITIEVASVNTTDFSPSDLAYKSLISLCADICKRNYIKKLVWSTTKKNRVNHLNGCNMTVHRDYAAKSCPGSWLYDHMDEIATQVNIILDGATNPPVKPSETPAISNEDIIWISLKGTGLNDYAVAGIMGNIFSESGFLPINLQNSFEKKLGMTDESYTKAVDDGSYLNFVHDKAGYGLCQWTFWSRKQNLLDYARKLNKSIGDIHVQLGFMWGEFQGYKKMMDILNNAKSVREASDAVLLNYEKPADQSEAVKIRRAKFGQEVYDRHVEKSKFPYLVKIAVGNLNIRNTPGTNGSKVIGTICDRGVYTIVEEQKVNDRTWGKLKSNGWINVSPEYVTKL